MYLIGGFCVDWVTEAIKLRQDVNEYTWEQISDKLYELVGEKYHPEKIRGACRRRLANLAHIKDTNKESFDESLPMITEENGIYTIRTRSSNREPVYISKNILRELKRMYCTQPYPTMNECSRRLNIPRNDFFLILKAFKITHDDIPFIDDDIVNSTAEELATESLEYRKHQYTEALSRLETETLRNENIKFRKKEYFYDYLHRMITRDIDLFAEKREMPILSENEVKSPLMLEIPIVDLHMGKLAWKPEAGENYDYKIAEKRFAGVVDDIIERIKDRQFEKILYPIGQDFFHFDTINTTTTAGTPLDSDLRWQKLFLRGVDMLIKSIDLFATLAPVEVLLVPGNHDKMTAFYAICFIQAWYKDVKHINVIVDPKTRKYFEFGKCLIGYTHGDKEGKRIFGNMQIEVPGAWGRTKYREWHTGHLHSEHVKEEHGVIVRRLSSVTGTDAWHFESGFVGAIAKHQSFIWDKNKGLSEILITVVE